MNLPLSRDEMLNRLIDALTGGECDVLWPIEWVWTVLQTCDEDRVEQDKEEDLQSWRQAVQLATVTVARIRVLLEHYRASLPVASPIVEEPPDYGEEIPF